MQAVPNAFDAFYRDIYSALPWPDVFTFNFSAELAANETTLHISLPPSLCSPLGSYETCAYTIAVVANCTQSTGGIGEYPRSGILDGSVRVLHEVRLALL
jgi:hypothetical protein